MTRWSAHLATLFTEVPWLERPTAAARAGFELVDSRWPGLDPAWPEALRAADLRVACLNAYAGSYEAGERGLLSDRRRHDEAVAAFREALELAREVGATRINVLAGRGGERRAALAAYRDCARLAEAAGVTLLVEAVNELDVPGYLVPTARRAVELVEEIGSDAVRILYDAYHAARAGADPVEEVRELAPAIGHVHFADFPGRGAPGTGDLDVWALADALEDAGYEGAIGLEYLPGPDTEASLTWLTSRRSRR